ncbi:hypothetical protein CHELA40_15277 [Chelatococcus asaccharovorans]|nr:hypothetical protein CHELA17_60342 [Chelatococcus asaccharovorans]CAH1682033.1 hypothetical protein CHELA40_15277 [Chelatococcus asaccharovorans]
MNSSGIFIVTGNCSLRLRRHERAQLPFIQRFQGFFQLYAFGSAMAAKSVGRPIRRRYSAF